LLLLSGLQPPAETLENEETREGMQAHLLRCAAGLPSVFHDDLFLFLHALSEPLPVDFPLPDSLPAGLEAGSEGTYREAASGREFIWVPPVAHWLGAGATIRRVVPEAGFFISKLPLLDAGGSPILRSREEALDLSHLKNVPLALPTADEWEMAARGPDGRRFPWGNKLEDGCTNLLSPWGMGQSTGVVGQWTQDGWICGLRADPRCSARHAPAGAAAVRLKIA
jgi:sulfatase-modifying factor enzyme 1